MREWWQKNWLAVAITTLILLMVGLVWYLAISKLAAQEKSHKDITLSRQLNNEAIALLEKGDKIAAAEKFELAHEAYPNKQAAINTAVTYEELASAASVPEKQEIALQYIEKAVKYYQMARAEEKNKKAQNKISARIAALEKQRQNLRDLIAAQKKPPIDQPRLEPLVPNIALLPIEPLTEKPVEPEETPVRKFKNWKWITLAGGAALLGAGIGFNCWAIDKAESAGRHDEYENAEGLLYSSYIFYALGSIVLPVSGYFFYQDYP